MKKELNPLIPLDDLKKVMAEIVPPVRPKLKKKRTKTPKHDTK